MAYNDQKISLIIPTLNAERYLEKLLNIIDGQTVRPDEIIVIDSASGDNTIELCKRHNNVKVIEIKREEFDHGGTRNQAIEASSGDIILMLSQDVTPIHHDYVEKVIRPLFDDEKCAACSGRQIAYESASQKEKLIRTFNYKAKSFKWDKTDIQKMGIKAFFLSDCCAAYRKKAVVEVGMYKDPSLANEDMILVSKLLVAGYRIAYAADARVYHSHDYTLKKQYKRNFDIGAGMEIDSEYFIDVPPETEGIKLAKYVLSSLLRRGHIFEAVRFCIDCAVRLKAHRDGRNWKNLSKEKLSRCTSNVGYWKKIGYIE